MTTRHIRAIERPGARLRRYLGDGVYAVFDGFGIWLTAEDGIRATDAIYLEPPVYTDLVRFFSDCKAERIGTDDPDL